MGDHSAIEWTEATWNPTTGCDKTSPGCDNCYALTLSKRLKAMGQPKYQSDGDPERAARASASPSIPTRSTSPASGRRHDASSSTR